MSRKRIFFLTAALISVAVYYSFFEFGPTDNNRKKNDLKRMFHFKEADVEEIKLVRFKDAIVLKKEVKEWKIIEPLQSQADAPDVYRYIKTFAQIVEIMVVDENTADLSLFGLDNPLLEVSLKLKGDSVPLNIQIGNDNPSNTCCYAKKKDSNKILLIGKLYKTDLNKNINYFRK